MPHVVFIAPRFLTNMNRYVQGFADLPDVTLSVVSQDPESSIPANVKGRVAGHYRVDDSNDAGQLTVAVRAITKGVGKVDRLAGALEEHQQQLAEVRDALDIEGMRGDVARAFRDKDRMKELLRAKGLPVAKSRLVTSLDEVKRFAGEVGVPIILKPQAGLGARSTYRLESNDDLAALERKGFLPTPSRPLQVEEFIRARERTCETVTVKGKPVWRSGTRYEPAPLTVLENPWMQYCVVLPREEDDPDHVRFADVNGRALAALFGDAAGTAAGTALTHMEWFLRDDGTALVNEVGARPPGVLIMPLMSIAHETNFWADWAELIALDRFTPKPRKWAAGGAFFRGQGSGERIASVEGIDAAIEALGDELIEMRTPKVGQPRATSYEGEGWATVRASTTAEVERALLMLVRTVQVRYG